MDTEIIEKIKFVLKDKVAPSVAAHGGKIEFKSLPNFFEVSFTLFRSPVASLTPIIFFNSIGIVSEFRLYLLCFKSLN